MKQISFGLLAFLLFLTGCVPVTRDTRPKVAFINAPTESRVSGLAEDLEGLIREQPTTFGFSRASAIRFQETSRDMFGSRAPLQAAFIARSQGAVYSVMVGFENEGDVIRYSIDGMTFELTLSLRGRAKASIVDPTTAEVIATFVSSEVVAKQYQTVTLELPEGLSPLDPRARSLLEQQADDVKERALERFLEDNARQPLSELVTPLTNELTTLTAALTSL
jgi:hypothetical protein